MSQSKFFLALGTRLILFGVVFVLACCSSVVPADQDWPRIRAEYLANVDSVATIDLTAELTCGVLNHGKRYGPGEYADAGQEDVTGCQLALHWIKDGQSGYLHVRQEQASGPPDPVCIMVNESFSRRVLFSRGQLIGVAQSKNKETVEWEMKGINGYNPFLEAMGWNSVALIANTPSPQITSETLDGENCLKVMFGAADLPTINGRSFKYVVTGWFDQNSSRLKRIEMHSPDYPQVIRTVSIRSFATVSNIEIPQDFEIVAGTDTGHYTQGQIVQLKVNEPVPSNSFTPPTQYQKAVSVNVDSKTDLDKFHKRRAIEDGSAERLKQGAKESAQQFQKQTAQSMNVAVQAKGISAKPDSPIGLAFGLAILGGVLLASATMLMFRGN